MTRCSIAGSTLESMNDKNVALYTQTSSDGTVNIKSSILRANWKRRSNCFPMQIRDNQWGPKDTNSCVDTKNENRLYSHSRLSC